MALSGSLTTNKYYYGTDEKDNRYYKLTWTATQSISDNTSTIKWTLSAETDATYKNWYAERTLKLKIDGSTVFSKTDRVERYNGVIKTGETKLTHNTNGSKEFKVSIEAAVYGSSVNVTGDKTFTLDNIPRYATATQSLNSKTETTIKMNWESDSTIDYIWYSKDNGANWTGINVTDGKSGTYTISGLNANTKYNIKTRVRRKDSQLTTDSTALSVTTYNYPYCTKAPNFVIGEPVTLEFYNPLNRKFDFMIAGNGQHIYAWTGVGGTTYKGIDEDVVITALYDSIPNSASAKYTVETVYNDVFILKNGGTYSVSESKCAPTFTNFTYKDVNTQVTNVTGNNQILVKGKSTLSVVVSVANKMVAKNSATPKRYTFGADTLTGEATYSENEITKQLGVITSSGVKRINVRAYDSREIPTLAYKDVTVYEYAKPVINVSAKRKNNFEAETTLTVSGTYSRLTIGDTDKNTIKKVEYQYRETGGTWSDWTPLTTTLSSGKFTCNKVIIPLENTKSFEFNIKATDNLDYNTAPTVVDVGQAVFFVSSNKKTAYLNGKEVAVDEDVPKLKSYISIPDNTDLNDIVTIGTYRSTAGTHTVTMENYPPIVDGGFKLIVSGWTGNSDYTVGLRQDLYFTNTHFVRRTLDGGATWGAWRQVAYIDNIVDTSFPVGCVYTTATNTNPKNILGRGTWELIDKEFTPKTITTGLTINNSVVSAGEITAILTGHMVSLFIRLTNSVEIDDTNNVKWGTVNPNTLGCSSFLKGLSVLSVNDGANGCVLFTLSTDGEILSHDTVGVRPLPVTGTANVINEIMTQTPDKMLDAFCNKFYWKRTA